MGLEQIKGIFDQLIFDKEWSFWVENVLGAIKEQREINTPFKKWWENSGDLYCYGLNSLYLKKHSQQELTPSDWQQLYESFPSLFKK